LGTAPQSSLPDTVGLVWCFCHRSRGHFG